MAMKPMTQPGGMEQPAAGMMQQGGADAAPDDTAPDDTEGQGEDASPEEQAAYEKFVNNTMNLIYDEKGVMRPAFEQALSMKDPVAALATVTATAISQADQSAAKAGVNMDGDALLHAGKEVMAAMADYADAKGIHTYTDEELKAASMKATDKFRELQGKNIDQGAAQQDFETIKQASKAGTLDKLMPGVSQFAGGK